MLPTWKCPLPDLILNNLCRTTQAVTICMTTQGSCCIVAGQNPKDVLHNPSPAAESVIEYPLIQVQVSAKKGFHQPGLEREDVVTNEVLFFWARGLQVILMEGRQWCYFLSFDLYHCTGKSGCQM